MSVGWASVAMARFAPPHKAKFSKLVSKNWMQFDHCAFYWWVVGTEGIRRLVKFIQFKLERLACRRICVCQSVIHHSELYNTIRFCEADRYLSRIQKSTVIPHTSCSRGERLRSYPLLFDEAPEQKQKNNNYIETRNSHRLHSVFTQCANLCFFSFVSDLCAVMRACVTVWWMSSSSACFRFVIYSGEFLFRFVFCSHTPSIRRFRMPNSYFTSLFCFFCSLSPAFCLCAFLSWWVMSMNNAE